MLMLLTSGAPGWGAPPVTASPAPGAVLFQNLCIHCHGSKGEGNATLKAPSIAGLPDWYVVAQLQNFQFDRRGVHAADTEGQMMRAISKALTPQQIPEVASHVTQLPRVTPPPANPAVDLARGKELYEERCMECHRYNGEGELVFRSPPLVGFPDWYLTAQLRKFQRGLRGAEIGDEYGKKMILSSSYVDDEPMLQSLVAYLLTLQSTTGAKEERGGFGED
ncbi:c-type cytochrome [Verrucomicrobium sp. BvORR034]|uniref:c-type cytochrome n=1 Tax=Verrucomicrobium sp. BvORR034 TaxID=1396418 RepID=UPI002240F840|nr:c-type cytochrome [Verrucomicrobium sp. BvORR034]